MTVNLEILRKEEWEPSDADFPDLIERYKAKCNEIDQHLTAINSDDTEAEIAARKHIPIAINHIIETLECILAILRRWEENDASNSHFLHQRYGFYRWAYWYYKALFQENYEVADPDVVIAKNRLETMQNVAAAQLS